MFSLTSELNYYLYNRPTDMRKGFNGLYALVCNRIGANPLSGDVFVFVNRQRDKVKMLRWEPGGFVCYYKRLEQGSLKNVLSESGGHMQIGWTELMLLIEGITVEKFHRRKRFTPP